MRGLIIVKLLTSYKHARFFRTMLAADFDLIKTKDKKIT